MLIPTSRRFLPFARIMPKNTAARAGALLGCAAIAAALTLAAPARTAAAQVSGTLAGTAQQPDTGRRLHFENRITGDIYIVPIHDDGSFVLNLPPGGYDLRAQRGVMVLRDIAVADKDVALGKFQEHSPNPIMRVLDWESLFPTLLTSPAPSAAYLYTVDTTVLPPNTIAAKTEALKPIPSPPAAQLAPAEKPVAPEINGMMPLGKMAPVPYNQSAPMPPPAPSNQ
ncbi:MAG: hypothetical protein ACREQN_01795 [Candidatus Binataceae bacterium]